jgi:Domain of unknown function (DUF4265)
VILNIGRNSLPLVKVKFFLNTDEWHGFESETVWSEEISNNKYRIRNTPFYAKDVSFQDVVKAKKIGQDLCFENHLLRSGHSTYRIILDNKISNIEFQENWKRMENLGCSYERTNLGNMKLFAVDVPPLADIHTVYTLLEEGEEKGVWEFEEGHCGHLI